MSESTQSYIIFSPMEGRLVKNGEPLSHTRIVRKLRWNSNEGGTVTDFLTDADGYFALPLHVEELDLHMMDQFAAKAELDVDIDGQIIELWYNNKFIPEGHAETDGALTGLVCDIDESEVAVQAGLSTIMTRCRWANMRDEYG